MTCDMDNTDKVVRYFEDCQRLGIRVLSPEINRSGLEFSVPARGEIAFALTAIKGIGQGVVKQIMLARESGAFRDLADFAKRFNLEQLGKKTLQLLCGAGALDCFGYPRKRLDELLPEVLAYSSSHHAAEERGERGLFDMGEEGRDDDAPHEAEQAPWEQHSAPSPLGTALTTLDDLLLEKKLIGMFVSAHPLASLPADFKYFGATASVRAIEERLANQPPKQAHGRFKERLCFIALLSAVTYRRSKKGNLMASVIFEQPGGGRLDVLVFEDLLKRLALPPIDTPVLVVGNLEASFDQETMRFNVEMVRSLEEERRERLRGLVLTIDVDRCTVPADHLIEQLSHLFAADVGTIPSRVKLSFPETVVLLDTSTHRLRVSNSFLHQLSGLLGGCGSIEYALH
jgi:DNA polymerase-3 subunit alpha